MDLVTSQSSPLLVVLGEHPVAQVDRFRRYALDQGCTVQVHPNGISVVNILAKPIQGIVIFEEDRTVLPQRISQIRKFTRYLDAPIVAVTPFGGFREEGFEDRSGAYGHCPLGSAPIEIFQEMMRRCEHQPVLEKSRAVFLAPLTESLSQILQQQAGLNLVLRSSFQKSEYHMTGDLSAIIPLYGTAGNQEQGALTICFPELTAVGIACRMLAEKGLERVSDDTVKLCIGKIVAAMRDPIGEILARASTRLRPGTPFFVTGSNHEIRRNGSTSNLVAAYGTEFGEFALQLSFNSKSS